jgi:hypothetical protein
MRYYHLLLILSLVLILSLSGCSGDTERTATESGNSVVTGPELGRDGDFPVVEELGCRVTGGGVDVDGNWNGKFDRGQNEYDRYQFGGQAGANTASFVFHAGTASAPEGTEIGWITCSDGGFCNPARHAPAKQIDFWGVGTFKNMKDAPPIIADHVVVGATLHRFEVNIDDAGERGGSGRNSTINCPDQGFGRRGGAALVDCNCFDFYRITIYADETPGLVIYQVYGYIKGGNLQIHPLTGFDSN